MASRTWLEPPRRAGHEVLAATVDELHPHETSAGRPKDLIRVLGALRGAIEPSQPA